ncbi:hypothetical protein DB29_04117 [Shouchella clausii]|nr:hypothetical protein DB29_04117 [Shouchella clausii]
MSFQETVAHAFLMDSFLSSPVRLSDWFVSFFAVNHQLMRFL